MGKTGLFILLFAISLALGGVLAENAKPQCKFTSTNGFYSHVSSDLPIGDVVFRGSVTPSDAEMVIANVRSDVLKDLDWSDRVVIDRTDVSAGGYLVRLAASLSLPVYPSSLREANLFITVVCNGYAYPLFTVHIDSTNRFAPQFYNEPYVMAVERSLPPGSVLESPVAAIDWDPADSYQMRFWLEDSHKGFILLDDRPRVTSSHLIPGSATWQKQQLPTVIRLQVTGPYTLPLTLRLIASDNSKSARKSTTFINLVEKLPTGHRVTVGSTVAAPTTVRSTTTTTTTTSTTSTTTMAPTTRLPEVIVDSEVTTGAPEAPEVSDDVTTTPEASETLEDVPEESETSEPAEDVKTSSTDATEVPEDIPEAKDSVKDQKLIHDLKSALKSLITTKKSENQNEDDDFDAIAFAAKNAQINAIETDETVDQIEAFGGSGGPTRFSQCSMRTSLLENSPNGTEIARLEVLNWKNDTRIRLIDPDGTFGIENDTLVVNDSRLVDRELFNTLELVAEIQEADPSVQCTRIRVYIDLDDENDNRPVFEHENYFFHISEHFPPGREIGRFVAQDIDQGANGQITYHLLTPEVPFQVGTQGKWGLLMSAAPLNSSIVSYNLAVEARDHGEKVTKSARVPVEVFVLTSSHRKIKKPTSSEKTQEGVVKASGVRTATTTTTTTDRPEEVSEDDEDVEVVTVIVEEEVEEEEDPEDVTEAPEPQTTSENVRKVPDARKSSEDVEEETATPEDVRSASNAPEDVTEAPEPQTTSENVRNALDARKSSENVEEETATSEDVGEDSEASEDVTHALTTSTPSRIVQNSLDTTEPSDSGEAGDSVDTARRFDFKQPVYSYQAFGMEIQENDVLGRVEADPNPEFYAIDREVIGLVKINEIGELLAGKKLNRHADGPIRFGVSATNGFETVRAQVTLLRDANQDVMSATPRFDQDAYRFEIRENQPPEVIGVVRAFHSALSSSESVRLTYSLIAPAHIDELPFEIHEQSGEVSTSRPLDAEQQKDFKFQVRACLTQTICSTSDISVRVVDTNDNSPVLVNRKLEATVESDIPPGTKIAKVYASDADSSANNSRITFEIHSPENEIFQIDAITGQITTIQSLSRPLYTLLVDATDNGIPRRSDTCEVVVTVKGTNPSPPAFDQNQYKVTIGAPIRAGQVIGEVKATDPDPGVEGMVTYKLLRADNEDQNKFMINTKTGVISAMTQLDIADGPIELSIEASDNGKNLKRRVKTTMRIEIVDSKTLKFLPLPTTVYISTEKAVGSVILRVSASSSDDEMIKFRVLQDQSQFVIDGDLLRVANHLVEGESNLSIRAETDTVKVDHQLKVIVMSDRDKYPVFPQLTYDFDVSTEGHFPRVVHQFNAKLENGPLRYTFFPPTSQPDGLYLDEKTGELFVTSQFRSANTKDTIFVVVRAINQRAVKFYSDVGVAITPISASKPTLRFQQPTYHFEVFENLRESDQIGTVSVTGASGSKPEFSVIPDTGFLGIFQNGTLFLAKEVDAEEMEDQLVNEFTVVAKTSSEDAKARITVAIRDVNEFSPEFDEEDVEMSIEGHATPGTRIGRVMAHDRDVTEKSKLIYRIVGGSGRKLVFIQEDGTMIVGDEKIPDDIDSFDLIVEAVDRSGNHNSIHVTVYVDDASRSLAEEPPLFLGQPLVWNVTEGTTQSFELKASGSSGVRFRIIGGDADGHFDIVHLPEENTARLRIVSELDQRRQKSYVLQVEARDEHTQLTTVEEVEVNVLDGNEHEPMFGEHEYTADDVDGDSPIGESIITVEATDIDRDTITYSLQGDPCESEFSIDPRGRVAYKIAPGAARTRGSIVCVVVASDGKHSTDANLRLRIQQTQTTTQPPAHPNQAPTFGEPEYTFTISNPSTHRGQLLGTVQASDPDNDHLELTIEPTEYSNLFHVAPNGTLTIRQDQLEQPRYSFLVVATDSGTPTLSAFTNVKVTVATAESADTEATVAMRPQPTVTTLGRRVTQTPATTLAPTFSQPVYSWRASSESPVGSIIGQVEVNEPRNDITFSLISGDHLSIDPEGRVTVIQPFADTINDMVIVTRGNEVLAEARIVVSGATSTTTTTTSTTRRIITTTSPLPTLRVEEDVIATSTTTAPSKLSFSEQIYHASAPEGSYISGYEIPIHPPLLTNYRNPEQVQYSIEDTAMPFALNSAGNLVMFEADREKHASFLFPILARVGGDQIAHARINVTIEDVNDNAPRFKEHLGIVGVSRTKHVGAPIYQLKADDADEGNVVSYTVQSGSWFSIDEREGMIRVLRDLRDAPEDVEIIVTARDSGAPPLATETTLRMRMFDSEAPKLPPPPAEPLSIPTSMTPGSEVVQLLAGPLEQRIHYRLTGDVSGLFEIDPQGSLRLSRRPLDTESNRYHNITVTAEHPKTGTQDARNLEIYVEGRQTTVVPPTVSPTATCQFSHKVYRAQIKENSPLRTAVIRVQAGCQDPERKFRYAFHVPTKDFEIDSQSGQIYTSTSLDRETKSSYFLTVNVIEQNRMMTKRQTEQAVENASSKLSPWQSLVVVSILDENDNSPVFLHLLDDSTLSAVVDQNANLMTPVIHLQARDLDVSPESLMFGIDGSGSDYFHLNRTNGLIQLVKSLKDTGEEHFELHASVTDGKNRVKVPLNVYVLSVDTNVVQLTKDSPHSDIDPSALERKLTETLGAETRILVAQPFVDDNGATDTAKSHVFVYALEDSDRKPMRRDSLKELLMTHSAGLHHMDISQVSLLSTNSSAASAGPQALLTVILLIVLIALLIFICALIVFCTKRRAAQKSSGGALEGAYMINSVGSGPRPYDVENISRATAQTVLAARPLPDAHEHRIDITSGASEIERDDTTREFSNSVRERPVDTHR